MAKFGDIPTRRSGTAQALSAAIVALVRKTLEAATAAAVAERDEDSEQIQRLIGAVLAGPDASRQSAAADLAEFCCVLSAAAGTTEAPSRVCFVDAPRGRRAEKGDASSQVGASKRHAVARHGAGPALTKLLREGETDRTRGSAAAAIANMAANPEVRRHLEPAVLSESGKTRPPSPGRRRISNIGTGLSSRTLRRGRNQVVRRRRETIREVPSTAGPRSRRAGPESGRGRPRLRGRVHGAPELGV